MPDSADSYHQRLTLFHRLSSLSTVQLDQVIFALQPRQGLIPPGSAKPGDRVSALLQWAESEIGCGLEQVERVLAAVLIGQTTAPGLEMPDGNQRHTRIGDSVVRSQGMTGDRNSIGANHYYGLPETKPEATRPDRNERILIDKVWTEVEDRLRQSLHNAILMRLEMAEQRYQVSRPWDSQLRTAAHGAKSLAPGTPIAAVFDRQDVGGKLLILGNPGAGKTTTMLDLAAVLIQRANGRSENPIPVMFNLSSWQKGNQSIIDWLVGELRLKYGVSPKVGQTWLKEKKLLPLLDGLDELPPERQEPAVRLINEWLQSEEGPDRLLVCSRLEEYELYASKLELNGAICLEPLTDEQLQSYLNSLGMGGLWQTLQQDTELLRLVRTPLLLSVSILANDGFDLEQWQQKHTTQERVSYLLDAYVERRLHESVKSKEYRYGKQPTAQQTKQWLIWLAKQLKTRSEDEFLIEKIQPESLVNTKYKHYYLTLISCLVAALSVFPLLFTFFISLDMRAISIGLFTCSFIGFFIAFLYYIHNEKRLKIIASEDVTWSVSNIRMGVGEIFSEALKNIDENLIEVVSNFSVAQKIASIVLMSSFFLLAILAGMTDLNTQSLLEVLLSLLICALLVFYFMGIRGVEVEKKVYPNQGIWKSLSNSFIFVLYTHLLFFILGFLIVSLGLFLMEHPLLFSAIPSLVFFGNNRFGYIAFHALVGGLALSFMCFVLLSPAAALVSGFNAVIKHFGLRLFLLHQGCMPWKYARFLNYCTDRLLLQRVGGRYRFIHKLVQEHFASM